MREDPVSFRWKDPRGVRAFGSKKTDRYGTDEMRRSMAWEDGLVRRKGLAETGLCMAQYGIKKKIPWKGGRFDRCFSYVVSYTKNVDGISLFGDSLPIGKRRGEER